MGTQVLYFLDVTAAIAMQDSVIVTDSLLADSAAAHTAVPPILELKAGEGMQAASTAVEVPLLLLLVAYWGLFAFLRLFNYTLYQYRWRALINFNLASQYFRDQSVFSSTLHTLYHLHFLIGLSLFGALLICHYVPSLTFTAFRVTLIILIALIGLYAIRGVLGWLLQQLFRVQDTLRFAQFYSNLSYSYLAFWLMPVVTIGYYAPDPWPLYSIYAGVALVGVALLWRYYRGFLIVKEYFSIYKYRLFAYICTAEIAPVFLIVKGTLLLLPLVS